MSEEVPYKPGEILAGKYRVESVLGVGGFGAVVCAVHLQLDERVAIKTLLPHAMKSPTAAERFLREARAAVRIRSEHVARVTDVGTLQDGVPYMVMEFLQGDDLSVVIKRQGGQPLPVVVEWLLQAGEALAEAHSLGIVHRDLKPGNLFLTKRIDGSPCVKVLDFGISKLTGEGPERGMTKTSDVMGSPFYMSPEQMRSTRSVDARSDIWALGAIFFELLAGATPFDAETMTGLVVSIMQEAPRDLSQYRRDLPPGAHAVVAKCLQKDPAHRYPSVYELAVDLQALSPQRSPVSVQRIGAVLARGAATPAPRSQATVADVSLAAMDRSQATVAGVPQGFLQAQSWGATYPNQQTPKRSPLPLVVGGALALGAVAAAAFWLGGRRDLPASATEHSAAVSATQSVAATPPSGQPEPTAVATGVVVGSTTGTSPTPPGLPPEAPSKPTKLPGSSAPSVSVPSPIIVVGPTSIAIQPPVIAPPSAPPPPPPKKCADPDFCDQH